jgi:hypothetical protein
MTKIKRITLENIKAVGSYDLKLNGCSVLVTGKNRAGKSTILNDTINRFREKKTLILKENKQSGTSVMELTDGCIISIEQTPKGEKMSYITQDGEIIKNGVIGKITEKYFGSGKSFDIDRFLILPPKQQLQELLRTLGVDLTEIDTRYKKAYDKRTLLKQSFDTIVKNKKTEPVKVEQPIFDILNKQKTELLKQKNDIEAKNKTLE